MVVAGGLNRWPRTLLMTGCVLILVASSAQAKMEASGTADGGKDSLTQGEDALCKVDFEAVPSSADPLHYVATAERPLLSQQMQVLYYEWTVDEDEVRYTTEPEFSYTFDSYGQHTIDLRLVCEDMTQHAPDIPSPDLPDNDKVTVSTAVNEETTGTKAEVNTAATEAALVESDLISKVIDIVDEAAGSAGEVGEVELIQDPINNVGNTGGTGGIVDGGEGLVGPEEDKDDPATGSAGDESEGNAAAVDDSRLTGNEGGLMGSGRDAALGVGVLLAVMALSVVGIVSVTKWIRSHSKKRAAPKRKAKRFETPTSQLIIKPVDD